MVPFSRLDCSRSISGQGQIFFKVVSRFMSEYFNMYPDLSNWIIKQWKLSPLFNFFLRNQDDFSQFFEADNRNDKQVFSLRLRSTWTTRRNKWAFHLPHWMTGHLLMTPNGSTRLGVNVTCSPMIATLTAAATLIARLKRLRLLTACLEVPLVGKLEKLLEKLKNPKVALHCFCQNMKDPLMLHGWNI